MTALNKLETKLDDLLRRRAPVQLPEKSRKALVEYLPWVNLLLGLLTLWAAWQLWRWAHVARDAIAYLDSLSRQLGGSPVTAPRLTAAVWLGMVVLVVEGLMLVAAYPATRDRQKRGWDLLFWAALVNIVYGLVISFSSYVGSGRLIWSLLTSLVGLYFLFQVREYYNGRRASARPTPSTKA